MYQIKGGCSDIHVGGGAVTPTVPKVGSAPGPTGQGTNPQMKELKVGSDFLGEILQNTQSKTLNPWADSQV